MLDQAWGRPSEVRDLIVSFCARQIPVEGSPPVLDVNRYVHARVGELVVELSPPTWGYECLFAVMLCGAVFYAPRRPHVEDRGEVGPEPAESELAPVPAASLGRVSAMLVPITDDYEIL